MQALTWRLSALVRWIAADISGRIVQCAARIPILRVLPRSWIVPFEYALITLKGEGLFDADFYRLQNADVASRGQKAFSHYLRHGWREGRAPNARFDDGHYRAQSGLHSRARVSALAHYVALGQPGGLCPVPGIDLGTLIKSYPDLAIARMDPYRRMVGDDLHDLCAPQLVIADVRAELATIGPRRANNTEVDVVVPVYIGHAETLNTILHVLRAKTDVALRLIVVNDCSPDPSLVTDLEDLSQRGLITLIHQEQNQGFVGSINRGMAMHDTHDVIWLNSDTEVFDGWADRLRTAAYSRSQVATVTPLTNNGTICSYPRLNADTPGPLEIGWHALDRLTATANRGLRVDAPTAVGFATYVRRAALDALGPLDEDSFGRGYGEENDFSQRALAAGWDNLIAADVFVRHFGATSFKSSRSWRVERALRILDRRFPDYRQSVQDFLIKDPLFEARRSLDIARLGALASEENVLLITHSLGGGTQQHVQEETDRLTRRGMSVFVLSGGSNGDRTARLTHADARAMPSLDGLNIEDDELWDIIAMLRIGQAHIHHMIDFAPTLLDVVSGKLTAAGIPFDFVAHDYLAICPRINLVDRSGFYCGEPDAAGCQKCLNRRGGRSGRADISEWRQRYTRFLTQARTIRVPDQDVAKRLRKYLPELGSIEVRPHEGPILPASRSEVSRTPGPLRVAVIGAIGPTKGFDVILGLQKEVNKNRLPAILSVIGYTHNDSAARAVGVVVTGPYVNEEIDDLILTADPDLIWIPSVWPETYSYTLSIALRSGRPVAAFDIGALSTRLRGVVQGTLIPLAMAKKPAELYPILRAAAFNVAQTGGEPA
ncbi:MAG: glycosyltransferase [Pseudomonadota bacterium]